MRICYIANAQSPIAQNWIAYFIDNGHEVHIISSYSVDPEGFDPASVYVLPRFLSGKRDKSGKRPSSNGLGGLYEGVRKGLRSSAFLQFVNMLRYWLTPVDVMRRLPEVRRIVERVDPDFVHAMRVPFEGVLAAEALWKMKVPLLISVWGNDFTLQAQRFSPVRWMTRRAMKRANGLHPDCERDRRLAVDWGFNGDKPTIVLPGAGGVKSEIFHPGQVSESKMQNWGIPERSPVVLNPRGIRNYLRNDTFFLAIPQVLDRVPEAMFVGVGMQGAMAAERWVDRLGIANNVRLLPGVSHYEMAELFRASDLMVSPSEHDGTPNTLLEAMASCAFPVIGDIESVREWITHSVNGLLFDPSSPESLAKAIVCALESDELRHRATRMNLRLIAESAKYDLVMSKAEDFYAGFIQMSSGEYGAEVFDSRRQL